MNIPITTYQEESCLKVLKNKLKEKIEGWRPRTARLVKEFGNVKIDEVTIGQVIGGARDIKCLVTDISYLDPYEGIRFRGLTFLKFLKNFPKFLVVKCPMLKDFSTSY